MLGQLPARFAHGQLPFNSALGVLKMELLQYISTTLITVVWFIFSIAWFVLLIGIHNNTNDGNTFKLINPAVWFMPSEFNEKGNKYRKIMLWLYAIGFVIGIIVNYVV